MADIHFQVYCGKSEIERRVQAGCGLAISNLGKFRIRFFVWQNNIRLLYNRPFPHPNPWEYSSLGNGSIINRPGRQREGDLRRKILLPLLLRPHLPLQKADRLRQQLRPVHLFDNLPGHWHLRPKPQLPPLQPQQMGPRLRHIRRIHHGPLHLLHHLLLPVDDAIVELVCLAPVARTEGAASKRVFDVARALYFQVPVLMRPGQLPLHSV